MILLLLLGSTFLFCYSGAASSDRMLATDLKVLTLYHGRQTTYRRTSPLPQLKCVGGTAGCDAFIPQVVQCVNQGSDGYDIQWECKTDMDNAYRFGRITVGCEGYDYPDDRYIVKGSCGLEYTIDLTKEGMRQNKQHNYYGDNKKSYYYKEKSSSGFRDIAILVGVVIIIYAIYKTCLSGPSEREESEHQRNYPTDAPPPYNEQPPPYGFRSEYTPNNAYSSRPKYTHTHNTAAGGGAGGGGGFWTGAATGGLLGYLFGSSGSRGYQRYGGSRQPYYSSGGGGFGSMFGGSDGGYSSSGGSSRESSGTRTASGFGGTRRR